MRVLFLSHKAEHCGVYQYGKRVFEILAKDKAISYIYNEVDSYEEYIEVLCKTSDIEAIIYNYHSITMPWLNENTMQRSVKNIGIPHESREDFFDIVCSIDATANECQNRFSLPRPIFENVEELILIPEENANIECFINMHTETGVPIFGSFGFGFWNKGFDKIVRYVNEQYDNAIIKLVMPPAHFLDDVHMYDAVEKLCIDTNTKPGIILMISREFFSTSSILKFLKSNTMNIFLYDHLYGRGLSSAIDYAISVKKPIGISDSYMFRHIYSDEICLYKNSIDHCLNSYFSHLSTFPEKYSNENLIKKFREALGYIEVENVEVEDIEAENIEVEKVEVENVEVKNVEAKIINGECKKMKVEVSVGEAIDKLCILELKMKKIKDEKKKIEISKEIYALSQCNEFKKEYDFYYNLLMYVNEKIWDMTDSIKGNYVYHETFAFISNQIFEFNQKRFRIKNWFNLLTESNIKEQKSYYQTHCKILISNEEELFSKLPEIHYLALEYDVITFDGLNSTMDAQTFNSLFSTMKKNLKVPTIVYNEEEIKLLSAPKLILLADFDIPKDDSRGFFVR